MGLVVESPPGAGFSTDIVDAINGANAPTALNPMATMADIPVVPGPELTADELAAINGANAPTALNPVATMNDMPVVPGPELTADELAAINGANAPTALNPMATMNDISNIGYRTEVLIAEGFSTDFVQGIRARGQRIIDPSEWPGIVSFTVRYMLLCSKPGITTRALLYNLTDNETVSDSILTHTGDTNYAVVEHSLQIGVAPGEFRPTAKMYEVRLEVSAGGVDATDIATLTQASLLVTGV